MTMIPGPKGDTKKKVPARGTSDELMILKQILEENRALKMNVLEIIRKKRELSDKSIIDDHKNKKISERELTKLAQEKKK